MKKLMLACIGFALLTALAAAAQYGQEPANKPEVQADQTKKAAKPVKTVVGCLQKGDEPGEFAIRGDDGMVWELKSNTVKLEEHVGHKVSVAGQAKEWSKKEGDVEKASNKEEYGDIRVTSLKTISDSCK